MATVPRPAALPPWLRGLVPVVAALFGASVVAYGVATQPPVAVDAALYQHVGWLITRGGVPYVDVWDINPPLTFALTAALSLLAGGDPLVLHALSAAVTLLASAASVLLVGLLAVRVTGESAAGLAAGLVTLAVTEVYALPPYGARSQYFALLAALAALALARRDRPWLAGASVAAGAGFWQPGIGAVPLVLGLALQRGGRRDLGRAVAGGLGVAAATVLPFVAAGAAGPMVAETVVAPLYGGAPYTLAGRAYAVLHALGYAALLLPVAGYGWVRALAERDRWWIPAGGLVYTAFALALNMNGSLDLLLWLAFVALGVAVAVEAAPPRTPARRALVALVCLAVLVAPAWHLAAVPPKEAVETRREAVAAEKVTAIRDGDLSVPSMRTVYWERRRPDTCHYRLSWTERRWILRTDARLGEATCGTWPD